MERRRLLDGLVGAAVTVLVLVLVGVVGFVVLSEPAGRADAPSPRPTAGGGHGGEPGEPAGEDPAAPTDLAEGEVWMGDVTLEAGSLATADGLLRDVRADGVDVRTGPAGLTAASMVLDATVPFELVAEQVGEGVVVGAGPRGEATVARSAELLGRRLSVSARGTVEVVEGRLVIEPTSIDVGGGSFLSGVLAALVREAVTIEHTIQGVPEGMVLDDVEVQDDGFRARLVGVDVSLAPGDLTRAP
ncbi:LmeA family phospholipid-binding protein [Actinotalea sp. Marseille-Q4924]|uniref:LmeA family phospholipid-binding protein n=1 Tax=Actinotalea sp. Marseille-Q4924 TaxID=2866571 RepID=UPI001CE48EBE|nr:LmeA family phospholipid-binding protein [Actinotalea sp. Marseille-Q4924]